jgi:hypothetical protein
MIKKFAALITVVALIFSTFIFYTPAFAKSPIVEYLCEFGISFFNVGRYDDALIEFNKALLIDSRNKTAKKYIDLIFQKDIFSSKPVVTTALKRETKIVATQVNFNKNLPVQPQAKSVIPKPKLNSVQKQSTQKAPAQITQEIKNKPNREQAMEKGLIALDNKLPLGGAESGNKRLRLAGIKISGESQVRFGIDAKAGAIWKRANFDLNEKNWRMLSEQGLNNRENTYDPRIYDRLRVNLDTDNGEGLDVHASLVIDPWSFTGTSGDNEITIVGAGGDVGKIKLKYLYAAGYTLNQRVFTLINGDSFNLPEIKVKNGRTSSVVVQSAFGNFFLIPGMKLENQFQPVRELFFDFKGDNLNVNFFPFAYEKQAVTFDDPLKLSNQHTWWENSPWINSWRPGILNSGAAPVDYSRGYWDNEISFPIRDSEGTRLTLLRGFSFNFSPSEETAIVGSMATPKDPWQNYNEFDNVISALRAKNFLAPNLRLGASFTNRLGFNTDQDRFDSQKNMALDAINYVTATDLTYEFFDGLQTNLEVAHSQSNYDITDDYYNLNRDGYAYYVSLVGRMPFSGQQSILDTEYGYDGLKLEKGDEFFTKFRLFVSRMDTTFDQPLSSYVETRDDEYWSRHLHFRKPFQYYYQEGGLKWDDVKNFAIGNGIDVGRNTIGLRIESSFWGNRLENLFDMRNVHNIKKGFVENVSRDEINWRISDKLTGKVLAIYQAMPKTQAGVDPFIFNPINRRYYDNVQIEAGKDPSVGTGSLGLEYAFSDRVSLNGIWEYTNDISLGYDNFPRGILNDGNNSYLYNLESKRYRDVRNWLYGQQFFPKPPYPYYNIFRVGLMLIPWEKAQIYLHYTRNEYEKAGQVDDNMNGVSMEFSYALTQKLGFFFKYNYSRWQDLDRLIAGITKMQGHNNFFTELYYRRSEEEDFVFQYGEASRDPFSGGIIDIGWDPYGGSLRTIDTAHIVRLYYRKKF